MTEQDPDKGLKYGEMSKYLSLIMRLGLKMVCSISLFFLAGFYIEKHVPSKGLFLIVFTFLGVIGGFYLMFKEIAAVMDGDDDGKKY
jgi:F0F1-type ATP synthase assembly protein I